MTNLLTRAAWETRAADPSRARAVHLRTGQEARSAMMMKGAASEAADYLLFIDEGRFWEHPGLRSTRTGVLTPHCPSLPRRSEGSGVSKSSCSGPIAARNSRGRTTAC
jgi:hypothetical protein